MWKDYFVYTFYKKIDDNGEPDVTKFTKNIVSIRILEDFELCYISHVNADNGNNKLLISIENYSSGAHYISPTYVALPCISGNITIGAFSTQFRPYYLPKPIFIKKGSTIALEIADTSNADNYLRMGFHGSHFIKGDKPYDDLNEGEFEIHGFSEGAITITSGDATVTSIEFDDESDFLIKQLVCHSTGTFIVNISDEYGNNWFNRPIHSGNVFGDGAYPNNLVSPKFIKRNTKLSISLQIISGGNVNIGLIGNRIN